MDLSGAVIAVFGAGHGIGAEVVTMLRGRGATVYASALGGEKKVSATEVTSVDVRDAAAVETFLLAVLALEGKLDAVINSAGIAGELQPLDEVSQEDFDAIMRTNLYGTFHVLKSAAALLKNIGKGSIITVSSRAGHRSHPTLVAYSASKAATLSLCQGMAKELAEAGSDVLCCTVSPGGVDTRMRKELFGKEDSEKQQKPEIVADVILNILTGDLVVPQGGDVIVSRGTVEVKEPA